MSPAFFFFLDCEDVNAVTEKRKNNQGRKSYFRCVNFEMLLDSQVKCQAGS